MTTEWSEQPDYDNPTPGIHTLTWDPGRILPGVYRLRIWSTGGLETVLPDQLRLRASS